MREGRSPSESGGRARDSREIVAGAGARVAFTTFASNVGRLRSIALAAAKAADATSSSSAAPCAGSSTSRPSSACSTTCRPSSTRRPTAICRATRSWCCSPAARASRAPRSPASPRTTTRRIELAARRHRRLLVARHPRQRTRRQPHHQRAHRARHPRHHRPRPAGPRLRPSAPRRAARDVRLAEAADRDPGPRRADAPCRPCRSGARTSAFPTVLDDRRRDDGAAGTGRRRRSSKIDAGRLYKDGMLIGDLDAVGVAERRRLGLRRPCRGVSVVLDRERRDRGRSGDRADRRAARGCRRPADDGDGDGRRARHARFAAAGRGAAIRRWSARRCGGPCAPRSPRSGARSRFARSSSRSYDRRDDRPPQSRRHRRAGSRAAQRSIATRSAPPCRRRWRSPSMASRPSSSNCPTPRSS